MTNNFGIEQLLVDASNAFGTADGSFYWGIHADFCRYDNRVWTRQMHISYPLSS
jgi:hypothetical protein